MNWDKYAPTQRAADDQRFMREEKREPERVYPSPEMYQQQQRMAAQYADMMRGRWPHVHEMYGPVYDGCGLPNYPNLHAGMQPLTLVQAAQYDSQLRAQRRQEHFMARRARGLPS